MYQHLQQAVSYIKNISSLIPKTGIVLGTGLSGFGNQMEVLHSIPYTDIPNFPTSTVDSHSGNILIGKIGKNSVVALQGRFHYYEGYSLREIGFPIRVMAALGIKSIILSNAAGGLNPIYQAGDLVLINDHINLLPDNPLRGLHDPSMGTRFPDMLNTYDTSLINQAKVIAQKSQIRHHTGVYAALQGPSLETSAEHRYLRIIGADIVGMSTVPEVIVAKQLNLRILAISVVTNTCYESKSDQETTLEGVIKTASEAEPKLSKIVVEMIRNEKI